MSQIVYNFPILVVSILAVSRAEPVAVLKVEDLFSADFVSIMIILHAH
jgi:hypothetical protein